MTWLQTTIGQVCLPTAQRDPTRGGEGTFRYVDIAGIDRESKSISRADLVPCADAPSRARKEIQRGDVLVSTVRPNLNAVAQVPDELDGAIASTGFAVLRANPKLVESRYLFYRVQQSEFVQFLSAQAKGANYPAVTDGVVRSAQLPLPPISEQRRLVELLDEADGLRRLRREADAKAARILPALFLKMFGDPATNPKGWPARAIREIARVVGGATPRTDTPEYFDGGILWATPKDLSTLDDFMIETTAKTLTPEGLASCSVTMLPERSVLFSSRAPIGLVAINVKPMCTNQGFKSLVPSRAVSEWYLFGWLSLRRSYIESLGRGATFAEVSKDIVEKLLVPVPDRSLQDSFSRRMEAVRAIRQDAKRSSGRITALWRDLLQRAFSGDLTVNWRKGHLKELLAEMQQQAKVLKLSLPAAERLTEA